MPTEYQHTELWGRPLPGTGTCGTCTVRMVRGWLPRRRGQKKPVCGRLPMACCSNVSAINASSARWPALQRQSALEQRARHDAARAACARRKLQTLQTGGWCLATMAKARLFGAEQTVHLPDGNSHRMPASHVEADVLILEGLVSLLHMGSTSTLLSMLDLGAGVGQYGRALRSRFGHTAVRWRGYDGAGDIEEYTGGFVSFADLTAPVDLPSRADWVVSLEVGEHLPSRHELTFIRNLHAHACRGILLSWACYGGHGHVNRRPNEYIIDIFERLGYVHNARAAHSMRRPALRSRLEGNRTNRVYGWFARSIMVFERMTPLVGEGCTA